MKDLIEGQTPLDRARDLAATAFNEGGSDAQLGVFLLSWSTYLDHVAQTEGDSETVAEAYNRGQENARTPMIDSLVNNIMAAVQLLPRVEELDVRADLAEALGHKLEITPEEPDPGRDWSRVRGELFKPSGKWMYSVWLDYSTLRDTPNERGSTGPSGWHFAASAMAEQALRIATKKGTSGVTISELGTYWHLFVPNPPQGYPCWVRPALAENENQLSFDHYQDLKTRLEDIQQAILGYGGNSEGVPLLDAIQEVLNR